MGHELRVYLDIGYKRETVRKDDENMCCRDFYYKYYICPIITVLKLYRPINKFSSENYTKC